MRRLLYTLFMALAVLLGQVPAAHAQRAVGRYRPSAGQAGKDAVWMPTSAASMEGMFRMAGLTSGELLVELGAGDGRVSIAAAERYGVRARGVEYDSQLVALARDEAARAGVSDRVSFVEGDLFDADLADADVVAFYLMPHINARLRPKLLALKPGTRVLSQSFGMGDWRPDRRLMRAGRESFLWIVPARVAGRWRLVHDDGQRLELTLWQQHQFVGGVARRGARTQRLVRAQLCGVCLHFVLDVRSAGRGEYVGYVEQAEHGCMRGTVRTADGAVMAWTAARVSTFARDARFGAGSAHAA